MANEWERGPMVRVKCTNAACPKRHKVRLINWPRMGDVLLIARAVCVTCLHDMIVVNKVLRDATDEMHTPSIAP